MVVKFKLFPNIGKLGTIDYLNKISSIGTNSILFRLKTILDVFTAAPELINNKWNFKSNN